VTEALAEAIPMDSNIVTAEHIGVGVNVIAERLEMDSMKRLGYQGVDGVLYGSFDNPLDGPYKHDSDEQEESEKIPTSEIMRRTGMRMSHLVLIENRVSVDNKEVEGPLSLVTNPVAITFWAHRGNGKPSAEQLYTVAPAYAAQVRFASRHVGGRLPVDVESSSEVYLLSCVIDVILNGKTSGGR
jgi:hypothetical protein